MDRLSGARTLSGKRMTRYLTFFGHALMACQAPVLAGVRSVRYGSKLVCAVFRLSDAQASVFQFKKPGLQNLGRHLSQTTNTSLNFTGRYPVSPSSKIKNCLPLMGDSLRLTTPVFRADL
jgi:hypothetical protein